MKVRTIVPTVGEDGPQSIGTTIEHSDSWILADQNLAIAVDDEARAALAAWRSKTNKLARAKPIVTPPAPAEAAQPAKV